MLMLPNCIRFPVRVGCKRLSLPVRTDGIADLITLRGMFSECEYDVGIPPAGVLRIVDLGANCGFASAYFAAVFPEASIVAVEPDPVNLVQLTKTVAWNSLPVTVVAAAIASGGRPVFFASEPEHSTRSRIGANETGFAVCTLRLAEVLQLAGWDSIDLLKVDIEGGEKDLFCGREMGALACVRRIVFELHPWVDRAVVLRGLSERGFTAKILNDAREVVYIAERRE